MQFNLHELPGFIVLHSITMLQYVNYCFNYALTVLFLFFYAQLLYSDKYVDWAVKLLLKQTNSDKYNIWICFMLYSFIV